MYHSTAASPRPQGSNAKRRKLRKGANSCWECKRRKVRCTFDSASDNVCVNCRRRGTTCLSQEFPEAAALSSDRGLPIGVRIGRVEAQIQRLLQPAGDSENKSNEDGQNGDEEGSTLKSLVGVSGIPPSVNSKEAGVSCGTHVIEDISSENDDLSNTRSQQQNTDAKKYAKLSGFYINPESYEMIDTMSEPPRAMANRLVTTAANLVTAHDEILGSMEGLECVMMEGVYQANCGNLRRAWVSFRRAMALAQLMGIHRTGKHKLKALAPGVRFNTPYLWYRIVCTDRFLRLMLGLPQGSPDRSMTSEPAFAGDTEVGRLERLHCVIASRILERNDTNPESCSFDLTRQIDADLQNVAETMSSSWWLIPNLEAAAASCDDQVVFWEMLRLVSQFFHYNLLNQLHLPFMLRFTSTECRDDYYSQMACVNASREVLLRFNAFRSFNRVPYCCRAIDFLALVAALSLLLAHLDSHRRTNVNKDLNFLAHQRPGDRGMMEVVLEHMDQIGKLSTDALSAQSASLIRRLLAVEAEAATGSTYITHRVCVLEGQSPSQIPETEPNILRIPIPYLGTICIAREGVISKASLPDLALSQLSVYQPPEAEHDIGSRGVDTAYSETAYPDTDFATPWISSPTSAWPAHALNYPQSQQYPHPALTAGAEDWAFQGVDIAFFNNLIRGSMLSDTARTI